MKGPEAVMEPDKREYWFPAKRYGWGWGLPNCWQGWLVMLAYVACVIGSIPAIFLKNGGLVFGAIVTVATTALITVCWLKGEPPRWRWGERNR